MTDEAFVFNTEVRERKSTARGARYRVSGARTKYCGLPSDHLTAAQLKRRNGPVVTYNLSKPMKWETFKQLDGPTMRSYVERLHDAYGVGGSDIADMLGVSVKALSKHYHDLCGTRLPYPSTKHFRLWAWEAFKDPAAAPCDAAAAPCDAATPPCCAAAAPEADTPPDTAPAPTQAPAPPDDALAASAAATPTADHQTRPSQGTLRYAHCTTGEVRRAVFDILGGDVDYDAITVAFVRRYNAD